MNEQESQSFTSQGAAFQKIWTESMSKLMQAAFTFSPNTAPPELLREIRNGILRALADTWNEFMRSPQFQESMKQWMENAVAFRKMTNDFMAKVRKEMQAPSRDDVDAIMLTVRHMETRVLGQMEELSKKVDALNESLCAVQLVKPEFAPKSRPRKSSQRKPASRKNKTASL